MVEDKEVCLRANGKQTVKLRSSSIKFKNYFKQLAPLLKIYANFECNVKGVKNTDRDIILHTPKNIKIIFLAILLIKSLLLMINLVSQLFFTEEEMQSINSLKQFLKSVDIVKV